jgi:hypothetical protein
MKYGMCVCAEKQVREVLVKLKKHHDRLCVIRCLQINIPRNGTVLALTELPRQEAPARPKTRYAPREPPINWVSLSVSADRISVLRG